jgi:hypothetical protein
MPASEAERVLEAIKAPLEAVPGAIVERNSVLPEKVPTGGLIILRDGDPGEPEQALGGFGSTYYQHAVEIRRGRRCGGARRRLRRSPPADRCCARGGPDPRWSRLRPDLRPARTGHRGDRRRTGNQNRDAHRDCRLRERRSSLLTLIPPRGDPDGASLWFERAPAHEARDRVWAGGARHYIRMPFNRCNLGSEQGLIDDPVLGQGRDPLAPLQDVINDEGDIVVPVDPRYLGLWLTGLFGDPDTIDNLDGSWDH